MSTATVDAVQFINAAEYGSGRIIYQVECVNNHVPEAISDLDEISAVMRARRDVGEKRVYSEKEFFEILDS